MTTKIYLAGPMSGIIDNNFPAFFEFEEALTDGGWEVFNPAKNDLDMMARGKDINYRNCLEEDLAWICKEADAIAMMPGWENSKGARAEHATAVALGIQIIYY